MNDTHEHKQILTTLARRESQMITFSQAPTATNLSDTPFKVTNTALQSGWQMILKLFDGT